MAQQTGIIGLGNDLPTRDPDIMDSLLALRTRMLIDLHVAKPGKIVSYDNTKKTAVVQPAFNSLLKNGSIIALPPINDVPVAILQGGGFSLQFPIAAGDPCLLIFVDRDISVWLQTGEQAVPATQSLHDYSDVIALVGPSPLTAGLPSPSSGETALLDGAGTTKLGIQGGKLTIQNSTQSLLGVLQTLIEGIQGLTVNGTPVVDSTGKVASALIDLAALLYT